MTKKFVAVLEISENDPFINDLDDLKEEIEEYLYLPGRVVSIKPMPQKKDSELAMWSEYYLECGYNMCIDELLGENDENSN